jgi:solute carrier family 13 (sodium-dependent dicarboxylate transporter), member 2/3/5
MSDVEGAGVSAGRNIAQRIGFWAGPLAALVVAFLPGPEGMSPEAQRTAALAVWMAIWWATEAVPIAATSLLPLAVLPLAAGLNGRAVAAPYADPIVLLLMGGSMLAVGIERWGLHRRLALSALSRIGGSASLTLLAFMGVTAFLSMWISNTATALMMMPIALSVAAAMGGDRGFTQAMVLGVAYAATIGGLATPMGTPTNLIAMGFLTEEMDRTISFGSWVALGLPAVLILLPATWLLLLIGVKQPKATAGAHTEMDEELRGLGAMKTPEVRVLLVFVFVIALWICGQWIRDGLELNGAVVMPPLLPGLSDTAIVVAGAIAMMLVPAGRAAPGRALVSWDEAARIPWSVILLFGGGLSLAAAIAETGLAAWLGERMQVLAGAPTLVIALAVVTLVIFLTEFMSNVAAITMLLPVLAVLAPATGIDPVILIVPAAIAASCAFMMPAGTGPNAVAFSSGRTSIAAMMVHGWWLNLVGIAVITAIGVWLAPIVLG